jgi:hypothetical protein
MTTVSNETQLARIPAYALAIVATLKGPRSCLLSRHATIDVVRTHGLTTWFGNPGSSELTRPTLINIRTTADGA